MDIYPLGHSSFRIKGKGATIVTDPFDPEMVGLKFPKIEAPDLVTISHGHGDHNFLEALGIKGEMGQTNGTFIINGPGEYEIKGVTVIGVATWHDDKKGEERGSNTVYKFTVDEINICHLGDLGHKLTDAQSEEIGEVDILLVPVGGFFTIDAKTAAELAAKFEPKIIIPMHYKRPGLKPQIGEKLEGVDKFLKEMGAESVTALPKLSTSKDKLPENTTVVVLE